MEEPSEIARVIDDLLRRNRDLVGKRIVVTAGPTFEPIDPVRFLGNRSSGKMGFALAARAAARGASVHLIAGPVALSTPPGVIRQDVESAEEMRDALATALGPDLGGADALVMAAAVADFRPAAFSAAKIKKAAGDLPGIQLAQNPDLLREIGAKRSGKRPVLVGFALETGSDEQVLAYATKKLADKRVDVIVANAAHESLGQADNRVALVDANGASPFVAASKESVAELIVDRVSAILQDAL
jgi:phosphopantothenoylcysteine decarboxylase/phosphopantothenate--cysteine ligase